MTSKPNNTSLDDVVDQGIYYCNVWSDYPIGDAGHNGTLVVIPRIGNNLTQMYYATDLEGSGYYARSRYANGNFTDWLKVPKQSDIDALNSKLTRGELTYTANDGTITIPRTDYPGYQYIVPFGFSVNDTVILYLKYVDSQYFRILATTRAGAWYTGEVTFAAFLIK